MLQILPHPVWGEYGYSTKKGGGWIRDPRTWGTWRWHCTFLPGIFSSFLRSLLSDEDANMLLGIASYYFIRFIVAMQDPGTKPVKRNWPGTSIDLATGVYISKDQVAERIVSDFNTVAPKLRTIQSDSKGPSKNIIAMIHEIPRTFCACFSF